MTREPTEFGWWLHEQMDKRGIDQTGFGALAGVALGTLSRWIYGDVQAQPYQLGKLADALELDKSERVTLYRAAGHGDIAGIMDNAPARSGR